MSEPENIADHLYVRFRGGKLEALHHRFRRDRRDQVLQAVNVSADYGLVLANFGDHSAYDIVKREDDTLQRLLEKFTSGIVRRDYLVFQDNRHNDTFRQTWKVLEPA